MSEEDYQDQLERYRLHLDARKCMDDRLFELSGRLLQWTLTISGGALGLSITYIEKTVTYPLMGTGWLVGSWTLLAASVVSSLVSLHLSQYSVRKWVDDLDRSYINCERNPAERYAVPVNSFSTWVNNLGIVSITTLGLGLVSLFIFVLCCPPSSSQASSSYGKSTTTTTDASPSR